MTRLTIAIVVAILLLTASAGAQAVLVLPLENASHTPERDADNWLSESAAEGIAAHFRPSAASGGLFGSDARYALRREERQAAFDQLGLPPAVSLTHATVIKIAELTGADIVITGSYSSDSQKLTLTARALDMRRPHLGPVCTESGPPTDLLAMQDRLASALASSVGMSDAPGAGSSLGTASRDAWESYIHGLIAGPLPEQVKFFREAARIDPAFMAPAFQLGRIAFRTEDYAGAELWLGKLGNNDPRYLEANFLLGLSACHLREWEKAETAFRTVADLLPLNEAFNNLGVVEARQKKKSAADHFKKAIEGDPNDEDYSFNLGAFYLRTSDFPPAAHYLREALREKPGDSEAKTLLNHAMSSDPSSDPSTLERLKTNYEESNFRQFRAALRRAEEDKLRLMPDEDHGASHIARGRQYYDHGDDSEAIAEFREALKVRGDDPQAYFYMARAYLRSGRTEEAIESARRAADLSKDSAKKDPEPLVLLARIYKDLGKIAEARAALAEALSRDPSYGAALDLEREMKGNPQ